MMKYIQVTQFKKNKDGRQIIFSKKVRRYQTLLKYFFSRFKCFTLSKVEEERRIIKMVVNDILGEKGKPSSYRIRRDGHVVLDNYNGTFTHIKII